ncbi:MAG: MurT ligase domain-containing protein [Coriobacteriaceae bacterium]|nr:MurT ligase domain-containing protein [Coriobacteriaceae bacterium]
MSVKSSFATSAAGLARWTLRSVLHRSGGALPGKLGLSIDPELIGNLAGLLDASVVITGTNGKTTTTNLIADSVSASGATCVCNRAGNNMETGIAGALLEASSARRRTAGTRRVGVFECDELYTVRVLPKLKPTYFVLLNLFRDQLDRYGEIDHTQDAIARALASSPATTLIFNADDPLCAAIAERVDNPTLPFGLMGATNTESTHIAESRFCSQCNAPLDYEYVQYGQLGAYECPSCGWKRPELSCWAQHVELSAGGYTFEVTDAQSAPMRLSTKYNGLYMVYNILAACVASCAAGADAALFQRVLDTYVPTGGRMTRWDVDGRVVASDLAKNPIGFDRQIQQIKTSGGRLMAFYLNDAEADGRDVSWIWDVDFERLGAAGDVRAFVGGTRANDLQVRLKYAGIDAQIVDGIGPVLAAVADESADEVLYAVANYTAFPPIVQELKELGEVCEGVAGAHGEAAGTGAVTGGADTGAGASAAGAGVSEASAPCDQAGAPAPGIAVLERPLRIVHLYPDALNLYGDGGNAIVIERRCAWRGIPVRVENIHMGDALELESADMVLVGGGADRDQLSVANELRRQRNELAAYLEDGGAMLAICGSYQLLGRSYYMGDTKIEGLGLIGAETVRGDDRLTANVAVKSAICEEPLVGFENHGGRTVLDASEAPLGTSLVSGTGNNGEDGLEGCMHKGLIGTYLHGPALSKNPELADWLIERALERRAVHGDADASALLPLAPLDDACEHAARKAAMGLLG